MKRRRRLGWALALAVLLALAPRGARAVLARFYPLPHRDLVMQAARENGLSPWLVAAVIRTESHWRTGSTSPQGARGLMQVMPETGHWVADRIGLGPIRPEDLYDPATNIRVGTWYLAYLVRQFDGKVPAALAAYNGGDGPVRHWLEEGRWSGSAGDLSAIPFPETQAFVRRVLRAYRFYVWIYGNPEAPEPEVMPPDRASPSA